MARGIIWAGLLIAVGGQALAQTSVSPIPVPSRPAETQPQGAINTPQSGANQEDRQRRTQQGGSPADTRAGRGPSGQARQAQVDPGQSEADARHIDATLAAGTVTLQAANFADTKAQHPRVRRFAAFEREEQNLLHDVLHSLSDPGATASVTSPGTAQAASTAPVISDQGSALMERMSRAAAGPDFDRDFVRLQIERHEELLQIQERYLKSSPQNREQAAIAKMVRNQTREHLAELGAIEAEIGR